MKSYAPSPTVADYVPVYGYAVAQTLVEALKRCGDDLSWDHEASFIDFESRIATAHPVDPD